MWKIGKPTMNKKDEVKNVFYYLMYLKRMCTRHANFPHVSPITSNTHKAWRNVQNILDLFSD